MIAATNIVELISASSSVLVALAILVMAIRGFRRLEAKVGGVHVVAEQVNRSVNNVLPGEKPLRAVVNDMAARLDEHVVESNVRLTRIEEHLTKPPVAKSTRRKVTQDGQAS